MAELKKRTYLDFDKKIILFWLLIFSLIGLIYLAFLEYTPSYGETFFNNVSIKKYEKIGDREYFVSIKYCKDSNSDNIGILVSSKIESIPIPIDVKLEDGKCTKYVSRIQSEVKTTIKTSTFTRDNLDDLIKQFENKREQLNDQWILAEQKSNMTKFLIQDINKKISLDNYIQDLKNQIKSNKSSLITLISLK